MHGGSLEEEGRNVPSRGRQSRGVTLWSRRRPAGLRKGAEHACAARDRAAPRTCSRTAVGLTRTVRQDPGATLMRTFTIPAWIAMVGALAATARAQDGSSPRAQFDAITAEYKKALAEYNEASRSATTDAERQSVYEAKYPKTDPYAKRFRALADQYPDDPVALESIVWVLQRGEADDAMFPLLLRNVSSEKVAEVCRPLQSSTAQGAEPFLRTLLAKRS